jgi:hypothetical protein
MTGVRRLPSNPASIDLQSRLENAIINCTDEPALYRLLDQHSSAAAPSARLDHHLRQFINSPQPGLTAAVLRLYRNTGHRDVDIEKAAASFLKVSYYDGPWYDETIISIGWANELMEEGEDSPLVSAYEGLLEEIEELKHQELREFCEGYQRR